MAYLNVNRKGFITGPNESSQSAARDAESGTATDGTSGTQTAIQYYFNQGRGNTHRYIRAFLHFGCSFERTGCSVYTYFRLSSLLAVSQKIKMANTSKCIGH